MRLVVPEFLGSPIFKAQFMKIPSHFQIIKKPNKAEMADAEEAV